MPKCQGIIPARHVPEFERKELDPEQNEGRTYEIIDKSYDVPEKKCTEEATRRARNMKEVKCSEGEIHHKQDGKDKVYCAGCFQPGTFTHLDGKTTIVPEMSV